jgi:predicted ferric reductase
VADAPGPVGPPPKMHYSLPRAFLWLAVFFGLSLVPLAIGWLGDRPPRRGFFIEFGVALGFLALALLALQFLFSGRIRAIAPSFGMDNIIQFHREVGLIAVVLVLAHPIVLIAADRVFLEYFDPRVNFLRAIFLAAATVGVIVIAATSVRRTAFRLSYEWWRLIHGGLAVALVFIGLVHSIQVSHYLAPLWKKVVLAILIAATIYLLLHTRVVRPWLSRKRPYRVVAVEPERDSSYSLHLEPDSHPGMSHRPGQFAWLTIGDTPFTLQQHPFSFSSSARSERLTFTAKELGDFTGAWKDIEPGTRVFLEGPFGSFVPDPSPGTGLFLVMGGIGVTPAMSMLRTMRDEGDPRPAILVYANKNWEEVTFREELETLEAALDLTVVHVLEEAPEGWEGEEGLVSDELLKKYLPADSSSYQFFVCGPTPLMDLTELALRGFGISWRRIYTERFEIV